MVTLAFRTLVLFLFALTVGCSKQAPLDVEKADESAPKATIALNQAAQSVEKGITVQEKSTPRAPVTEDDIKIFDAVLLNMLDDEKLWGDRPFKIILDPMTAGEIGSLIQSEPDEEPDNVEKWVGSVGFREDLLRRNPEETISLAGYKPSSPKIVVEKLIPQTISDFSSGKVLTEKEANRYRFSATLDCGGVFVVAWLPGYSKDGNTAVFRAWFGPTAHGGTLTYKLVNKDGKWTVVWRDVFRRV